MEEDGDRRDLVHQLGVDNSQHPTRGCEASFYSCSPSLNFGAAESCGTHSHHRHVRGALVVTGLAIGGALGIGGCEEFVCSDLVKASTHQALGCHEAQLDFPIESSESHSSTDKRKSVLYKQPRSQDSSHSPVFSEANKKELQNGGSSEDVTQTTQTVKESKDSAGSSSRVPCHSRSSAGVGDSVTDSDSQTPLSPNSASRSPPRPPAVVDSSVFETNLNSQNNAVHRILDLFDPLRSTAPLVQLVLRLNTAAKSGTKGHVSLSSLRNRLQLFIQAGCFMEEAQRVLGDPSEERVYKSYNDFRRALVDIADGKWWQGTVAKACVFAAKVRHRVLAARVEHLGFAAWVKHHFLTTEGKLWKLVKKFCDERTIAYTKDGLLVLANVSEDAQRLVVLLDYQSEFLRYFCVEASKLEKELKEKKHETSRTLLQNVAKYAALMLLTSTDGNKRLRSEGREKLADAIAELHK